MKNKKTCILLKFNYAFDILNVLKQ